MACILADFAISVAGQIIATAVAAVAALVFWRVGGQFVGDYRRLCGEARTLLTMHARFIANLSLELPTKGEAARERAADDLRAISVRLTNADCPPEWLTRALGLPLPADVQAAGKLLLKLSNNLTLPNNPTAADKAANEPLNRKDRDDARRLLGCRPERSSQSR